MEAKIDTVKIQMSHDEFKALRTDLEKLLMDLESEARSHGLDISAKLREQYPEVNKLLSILNIDGLPF